MVDTVQRYKLLSILINLSPNSFVCFKRNYEFAYVLAEIEEAFLALT